MSAELINASPAASAVSLFDRRPFFEKALQFGVRNGILQPAKLDAIRAEAPKGMVQIAAYFGSEFLRPELERAKDRIVNLVSLYLEHSCGGDLKLAAESLRDHSFLSRSKGGSDMLKRLIAMPQNTHFGMNQRNGFTDDHIPQLAKWSLRSLADYQVELAQRNHVAELMDAATWLADALDMDTGELEDAGCDAEAVIRTALLEHAMRLVKMPDRVTFERLIATLRKKHTPEAPGPAIGLPQGLPQALEAVVESLRLSVIADLPKILDATVTVKKLFNQTPAFMGRYFWVEDALSEVEHHDRSASSAWKKATGGHGDEGSLLTLFLSVAAGSPAKTSFTEKSAIALIRKVRKTGLHAELATQYIQDHAPIQYQVDYVLLWRAFLEEAKKTLVSDADYELRDALALLRRECVVLP